MSYTKDYSFALAGFTLCGWKVRGGYHLGSATDNPMVEQFPEELELFGRVYTLEEINEFKNGFVNAEYC